MKPTSTFHPTLERTGSVLTIMKTRIRVFKFLKWKYAAAPLTAAAFICGTLMVTAASKPPKIIVSDKPIDREASLPASFAPIVKKVASSVVSIYSTHKVTMQPYFQPFMDNPMLRRFFGDPSDGDEGAPHAHKFQSLGSGIIVSDDGYILSNAHVVEGADDIKVALANDKSEYTAKVIGSDPQTDIAVLKIDAKKLKPITLADSDTLEVGDVVLAIGNPFGVGQTVTRGIISALGRGGFGIVHYEDFIQTDASINPGNSGGALVDIEGRLIGINQSIVSRSGGSQGVGFAVPVNQARSIMDHLITDGTVKRGYLGVNIQDVTSELADEFRLPNEQGALVGGVQPGTPAASAGLRAGDVIVEFNGRTVSDSRHLSLVVSETAPGTRTSVKVIRDGRPKTFDITLDSLPNELTARDGNQDQEGSPGVSALDGVELSDIDPGMRQRLDIPSQMSGALVTEVAPDSPAQEAGLQRGDLILEINRQPVDDAQDAMKLIRKAKGNRLLLHVWSKASGLSGSKYIVLQADDSK
jgi:serine protease Do